jgi:tRNA A37 methylthiotransferase MiaB
MRIVLVAIHPYPSPQAVPLGNAFLKAYLLTDEYLAKRISVTLCDFFAGENIDTSLSAILAENPDAVGISVYLWNRNMARELAAQLRRAKPSLIMFAGGPEATADPEGMLAASPLDFLILGDGEIPFVESMAALISGRETNEVKGIASLQTGVFTSSRCKPVDILDAIPSPYLAGIIDPAAGGGILWQISRGCDFGCDFCFDAQGVKGVRRFSMARVRLELDWFVKKQVAQVFVIDSTFNQDMKRAKEILRLIERRAPHIHFHFEVRSEFIDSEMARLFARINCSLQVGLQSAHPQVHGMIRRVFNADEFSRKIALLNESGAIFGFDLIYGLPGDTLAGFFTSIDFALRLYPNHLDIFPLAILPGTTLAARAETLGLRYLNEPPYTLQSSPGFPAGAMREAAGLAIACDIFYSRGKAVAWFNSLLTPLGFSPSSFLREFHIWLEEAKGETLSETALSDQDIWQAQRAFITRLYAGKRVRKLLPAALDQIDYHWHYAAALLTAPPELPTDRELEQSNLLDGRFILAPSARLAKFNYEIFDLLQAGEIDLRSFVECFTPIGSYAVIYPRAGEVFTESLIEAHYNILSRLDGTASGRQIAANLRIPADEAASFLDFAAAEGIICRFPQLSGV